MDGLKSIFREQSRIWFFVACGLFLIFIIGLAAPIDPDFGWHLRNGNDIVLNHSVPFFDLYSYTMSDFSLINYSWLSDLIISLFNKFFGLFGLSVLFSLISSSAFFVAARAYKTKVAFQIIIAIAGSILSISILGVRDQIWSLLGFAVLIFIILTWRANPRSRIIWWLPLLFLTWVNLHPAFAIGLGTLLIFFLIESLQKKFLSKTLILIFGLSCLATFINPFGPRVYKEIWITFIDFAGRSQILEWRPLIYAGLNVFIPTIIYGLALLAAQFFAKKRDMALITLSVLFFIFAMLAWRNLPLFFIVSSPLAVLTLEYYTGKNLLDMIKMPLTLSIIFLLVFFAGWRNIKEVWQFDADERLLAREAGLPYDAVRFLGANLSSINTSHLFNEYTWGGYILWQLPGQKVFIDGRMTHWQLPGRHIFADYLTIQRAENLIEFNSLIEKYDLNLALIRRDSLAASRFSILGWRPIWQDDLAIIMQK